jgi:hypothetical protein
MKIFHSFLIILISALFLVSCQPGNKTMTPEDFLKIENEYLNSDLKPESKEAAAKKYGYTLKSFTDFEEKVEKDPALKKKVGEVRLNIQKKDGKK